MFNVAFPEYQSRILAGDAAETVAVLRHLARNFLSHHPFQGLRGRTRRMKAVWDNADLLRVLQDIETGPLWLLGILFSGEWIPRS